MSLKAFLFVLFASCLGASAQVLPGSGSGSSPVHSNPNAICFYPGDCVSLPQGLVSWYPFEPKNGQEADTAVNSEPSVGYDKGTVGHSPGSVGQGIELTTSNSYVEVPGAPAFKATGAGFPRATREIDFFGTGFTVSVWFKTAAKTPISPILDRRSKPYRGYTLFLYEGRPGFQLAAEGQGPGPAFTNWILPKGTPDLRDGQWHYLAVSVGRTSLEGGLIYVGDKNGNVSLGLTFDPTLYADRILETFAPLLIGRHTDGIQWNGSIDEVMIFQKALTKEEVTRLANAKAKPLCPC